MHNVQNRFGLFPGRSPLLGESLLFSLPAGTKMFQFPAFACPPKKKRTCTGFTRAGCPIRKSAHQRLCAPTRGLSQLITSFIASVSLGIRHVPLHTFVAHTFSCRESGNCLLFSKFSYSLLCLSQYVKELSSECRKNTGKGEQRHQSGE